MFITFSRLLANAPWIKEKNKAVPTGKAAYHPPIVKRSMTISWWVKIKI